MLSRWIPRPSKPLKHRNGLGEFDSHTFPPIRRESDEPLNKRGVCCFYQTYSIIPTDMHKVDTQKVDTPVLLLILTGLTTGIFNQVGHP